jgi:DNA primase
MPLIPEQVLDEIQARADIAELIGRYIPLKRSGRHFKALCPFHKERTPSFHINTEKQIFHCFGCGVGGNIFSFLMQQERLTFPEAVHQLAEQVGVVVPTSPTAMRNGKTTQLLELLEKTCRYYERLLGHPRLGRAAREYLKRRGITDRTREVFRLGCAPGRWDGLVQAAKRRQISEELLEQAGLLIRTPRGLVDRFRQRLIFPIPDSRGRVVGFGGRSLAGQEPKYLNSPETPVYSKGRQLFGLVQAKDAILKAKVAVVVEGYFDCIFLWQAGLQHVVSPLGTAFTPEQARVLRRYTDRVCLAFDADAAGEMAALRGIDILVEAGVHVHVVELPVGVDPDEFVRSYGPEAFRQLLAKGLNVVEFLIACATKRYNLRDPEEKADAAQLILPTIAKVPNAILRKEYVRLIANRLDLDEAAVLEELGKVKPRIAVPPTTPERRSPIQGAERLLTALLLDEPARWDAVKGEPLLEQISDARLRRILEVVCEMRAMNHSQPTPAKVISRLAGEELGGLVSELVELAHATPSKDEALRECVKRLTVDARKRQLATLREQIRTAQQLGHEQELARLLANYQRLVKTA